MSLETIMAFVVQHSMYVAIFGLGYGVGAMVMLFGFTRHREPPLLKPSEKKK